MEAKLWSELDAEKRDRAAGIITEFSTTAVAWNKQEQDHVVDVFKRLMEMCQKENNLKPHQLVVVSKMLQEAAIADLYEYLPEDFEKWESKDDLMAMFFFGANGLDRYREAKSKQAGAK
ncbi:hypothetical protein [Ferviditalea candida]|uniref:Uncharacterized protein n=1 Tax=Ferviditalea candida TaxID=3108399 RepID=A0ABU5ZEJ8_9BACL|nr:hypothetical protein [Paenibacillaceae bacterium T2]